ncbi:substrate-binding domain-containing protein [Cytobacillus sp. FJAT-54145]|uniref:Substrate-binding domain-containing protein n=1 Tax=Cytobacillus spartinae TaxID=3299023 RepID=A0ABW6KHI4_9BACI
MRKNKLLFSSLIGLLFISLVACSSTAPSTKVESTNSQSKEEKMEVKDLILATTTSTQDSGLLDILIPLFEDQHPSINLKTIAVGTGQALEMGTKGEADVLLVHAPATEQEIVDSGDAINRKRVMYNDFIIVGPKADQAGIKGMEVNVAFQKLFDENSVFVSRGDDSGTHKKELSIWKSLNITPTDNTSYVETGQGMGPTLQLSAEKQGYVLTDRATFLAQEKNLSDMEITVEGDEALLNIYHVMQVNPEKHDKVYSEGAELFVEFMVNEETQKVIEKFGKEEYGQSLFFPYTE